MQEIAVDTVRTLRDQFGWIQEEADSIEAILDGTEGSECKADGRPEPSSVEERLESLHAGMDQLLARLKSIRKRVQQMSREI